LGGFEPFGQFLYCFWKWPSLGGVALWLSIPPP
jgi:hypothetical protein